MNFTKVKTIALVGGLIWMGAAMAIEEPAYKVVSTAGDYEVRHYAPMMVAQVLVDGDMDAASSKGFRLIADYIFGNNQSAQTASSAKIAMTAPVTAVPQSSKIAMTAPVTAEPQTAELDMQTANKWLIHFVMPSQYTLENIPKPKNDAVSLRQIPEKQFVVFKYSGFNTTAKIQHLTEETISWAKGKGMQIVGAPRLSRYDPPWTLPMFRRNEIMIEVAAP